MIKVVSFKICPFFQYVTAMLKAKGVPYEVEYADFDNCLFEVSPNGKAPILITEEGTVLFDADAIVDFIDSQYPGLYQAATPQEHTLMNAWSNFATKHYVAQCNAMRSATQEEFEAQSSGFSKALLVMEQQLNDGPFFKGEELSKVDVAWLPILHRARLVELGTGFDFFAAFPRLKQWQEHMLSLEWAAATVSDDFTQVFNEFYLSAGYLNNQ